MTSNTNCGIINLVRDITTLNSCTLCETGKGGKRVGRTFPPLKLKNSWASQNRIKAVKWGQIVNDIPITESNRASVWEFRAEGVKILVNIAERQYKAKGVNAVVVGITGGGSIKYAIFVQSGFLRAIEEE